MARTRPYTPPRILDQPDDLLIRRSEAAERHQEKVAWKTPTLLNSWVAYGSTWETPRFRLEPHGVVRIQGLVKDGSASTADIFTLPENYRPSGSIFLSSYASGGAECVVQVDADGDVHVPDGGSTTYTSISVSFAI